MDVLSGHKLMKKDGSLVEADTALKDKNYVLFYFSAHWCPPCRQFTPMLADFYKEDDVSDAGVEIVFVSSDRSQDDMLSYMKESHGDWLATEHGSELSNKLKQKFEVSGIPMLVICKKDGSLITKDGRSQVMGKGPEAVKGWAK